MSPVKQRLLILSFSPIHRDPRVLRQIKLFGDRFDVLTCGFGAAPQGVVEHLELAGPAGKVANQMMTKLPLVVGRRWGRLYESLLEVRDARAALAGVSFDAVLANDVLALPLATSLGVPVHADLHEYAMGQGAGLAWRLAAAPFLAWAAHFLETCSSVTTVAPGIAARYQQEFGVAVGAVPNGPDYRADLGPKPTGPPIRLVHVGVGAPPRSLELSVEAVARHNARQPGSLTLDLYLVPGVRSYIEGLQGQAGDPAISGVRVCDPVEFARLIDVIHQYDVGLFFAPPVTYNIEHALPNKFFEFVQARVGVIIGPSIEMAPYVERYGFGVVASGWEITDLEEVLDELSPQLVDEWKHRADEAALQLGADATSQDWVESIDAMMGRSK